MPGSERKREVHSKTKAQKKSRLGLSNDPEPHSSSADMKPKLIVFDLDYTLWPFWCDTHVSPPLRPTDKGEYVLDKYGDQFGFYPEIPLIFEQIKNTPGMKLCAASRTQSPRIAQSLLSMLNIDNEPSSTYFAFTAWGTGSKIRHFQELHLHTGVAYEDMLFFDDENRNRDVQRQLGVCFIEVPSGMTLNLFSEGIAQWQQQKKRQLAIKPST